MNGTAKTTSGRVKLFDAYQGVGTGKFYAPLSVFQWTLKQGNWLKAADGNWINCGSTFQYAQILTYPTTDPPPPPPPPPTGKILKNVINVYNDGSIMVIPQ